MKLRHIGDSIDHRMAQEVRHWFPQQGPLCWVERANRTVGTKYLGCPEISRTHGLMMSRLPNIRSENCEPESKPVFELTPATQTVVHGLTASALFGSW